jgi:putative ABC transport system permease protein
MRRTPEIGIRMALGAQRIDVIRMVANESLVPVAIGIAFGLCGSFALMRGLQHFLFGISYADRTTIAGSITCLFLAAALAAYLPARRASRIDPMVALRNE